MGRSCRQAGWGELEDQDRLLVRLVQSWLLFSYHIPLVEVPTWRTDDEGEEACAGRPSLEECCGGRDYDWCGSKTDRTNGLRLGEQLVIFVESGIVEHGLDG